MQLLEDKLTWGEPYLKLLLGKESHYVYAASYDGKRKDMVSLNKCTSV